MRCCKGKGEIVVIVVGGFFRTGHNKYYLEAGQRLLVRIVAVSIA